MGEGEASPYWKSSELRSQFATILCCQTSEKNTLKRCTYCSFQMQPSPTKCFLTMTRNQSKSVKKIPQLFWKIPKKFSVFKKVKRISTLRFTILICISAVCLYIWNELQLFVYIFVTYVIKSFSCQFQLLFIFKKSMAKKILKWVILGKEIHCWIQRHESTICWCLCFWYIKRQLLQCNSLRRSQLFLLELCKDV